jgi:hypothetical protein
MARFVRLAAELAVIALVVTATVTGSVYGLESPYFDHPFRGEIAWWNFVTASTVLSILGIAAASLLWHMWRRRAALDTQPDAPARLLALAVATLPESRREWGAAMIAELSSVRGNAARWRFAAGSTRASLFPPTARRRPATGWAGAAVGVLGVLACAAATVYMFVAFPETANATSAGFIGAFAVILVACLALTLAPPQGLTSSAFARHVGLGLGLTSGAGLLLLSRAGGLESGAMAFIMPAQFAAFVVIPAVVAAVARSIGAAVQSIVWSFIFSSVTMFPIYIVESIRRYQAGSSLYLDGDAPLGTTIGTNLNDAVGWLLLVVPSLMIPFGITGAAIVAAVAKAIVRAVNRSTAAPA